MIQRPLSPHLQIYKPQITSILSILHRITGVVVTLGLVGFCFWIFYASQDQDILKMVIQPFLLKTVLGKSLLIALLFSLFFHFFNGIRHLVWDTGKALDKQCIQRSGLFVVCLTLLATGYVCLTTFWA